MGTNTTTAEVLEYLALVQVEMAEHPSFVPLHISNTSPHDDYSAESFP